jgi:hypothetical protein
MKRSVFKLIFLLFVSCLFVTPVFCIDEEFPLKANYYLGELRGDTAFIDDISRYDLLVLTPSQMKQHRLIVSKIKHKNPDIILLAYLPSQSYNTRYWPRDIVFRSLHVNSDWWVRDSRRNIVSVWDSVQNINMDPAWSRYLISFYNREIASIPYVDGVFFDMVSHNISWLNNGDIDLDVDGRRDSASQADALWLNRTTYLLEYAKNNINAEYIVINGSSHAHFQSHINGRMFETFPTPWEENGSWEANMNNAVLNKKKNQQKQITIFNTNTDNTGQKTNYKKMRYGFTSALLEGAYSSFDYGDTDHAQLWWYDEYNANLGTPLTKSTSKNNHTKYQPDVWQRQFENGMAVVNSKNTRELVELGGEYESLRGSQDPTVNDGSIISELFLDQFDGRILLKTFSTLKNTLFTNGAFARFFRPDGERVRNGFFIFEEAYKGGDQIIHTDLNSDGKEDLLVVSGSRIQAWRHDGQPFFRLYPYTARYRGKLKVTIADLDNDRWEEIIIAPSSGHNKPVKIYQLNGANIKNNWYPLGEFHTHGYNVAVGEFGQGDIPRIIIASDEGGDAAVSVFDLSLHRLHRWQAFEYAFRGGVRVGAGDLDGDGEDEIVAAPGPGGKPWIKTFTLNGEEKYPQFMAYTALGTPGIGVEVVDVDFDGKDDIVGLSEGF